MRFLQLVYSESVIPHRESYKLELDGHAMLKSYGPDLGLKANRTGTSVRMMQFKDDKLYPGGAPRGGV